mgnify:CR=1 FL=1
MVLEFDMEVWRVRSWLFCDTILVGLPHSQRAIEVFEITESMIPERKQAATKLGNKWYG